MTRRFLCAGAAAAIFASSAHATWSLVLVDTRTGEVAAASATCLTELDLQSLTPVMLVGVGACTAQSSGDSLQVNRTFVRDRLAEGVAPDAILAGLATFDGGGHQTRQYGLVDARGRTMTFSGRGASAWAGGRTGTFSYTYAGKTGTIAYAVQGNILTGAPVVDRAVDAIIATPGDLAARLMAGMEAARLMGGDGRCSCPGTPTGCGSPPPMFTKSAHIGYMLISRPGDGDGGHGVYRTSGTTSSLVVADATGDVFPELFAAPTTNLNAQVFRNQTPLDRSTSAFSSGTSWSMGSGAQSLAIADVTGDGRPDLLTANLNSNTISIRPGLANFSFGALSSINTGMAPKSLVVAQLDGMNGPDLVYGTQTPSSVAVRLSTGPGTFGPATDYAFQLIPKFVLARDMNRDGRLDLLVATAAQPRPIILLGNGDGTFAAPPAIAPLPIEIDAMAAGDLDNDLDDDVVCIIRGQGIQVFLNNAGTLDMGMLIPASTPVADVAIGDVNGDGRADLASVNGSAFVRLWIGNGTGAFTAGDQFTTGWGVNRVVLADLDADGDLDAALVNASSGFIVTATNRGGGRFDSGRGTAFGDYFMSLNVPNASDGDPDPVFQLRDQFNAWRAGLTARPDGVQSLVLAPVDVPAGGAAIRRLRVTIRDWRGEIVANAGTPVMTPQLAVGSVEVGPVTAIAPGVFEATITGGRVGNVPLRLTIQDGTRIVRITPDPIIRVGACPADLNRDGGVTIDDLAVFAEAFERGQMPADLDDGTGAGQPDGGATIDDLLYFLDRYALGC